MQAELFCKFLAHEMIHPDSGGDGDIERFLFSGHREMADMISLFLGLFRDSRELVPEYERYRV